MDSIEYSKQTTRWICVVDLWAPFGDVQSVDWQRSDEFVFRLFRFVRFGNEIFFLWDVYMTDGGEIKCLFKCMRWWQSRMKIGWWRKWIRIGFCGRFSLPTRFPTSVGHWPFFCLESRRSTGNFLTLILKKFRTEIVGNPRLLQICDLVRDQMKPKLG